MVLPQSQTGIPSKQFDVWRRLYARYILEPFPVQNGGMPDVFKTITPVTQADDLLRVPRTLSSAEDISASAGTYTVYQTVPAGKRWRISMVERGATTGASRVRFRAKVGDPLVALQLGVTAGLVLICDLTLDELADIGLDTTGDAGDTARFLGIHLLEEDAF